MAITLYDAIGATETTVHVHDPDALAHRYPFHATIESEVVLVTGGGTTTPPGSYNLFIVRGVENTTPASHAADVEIVDQATVPTLASVLAAGADTNDTPITGLVFLTELPTADPEVLGQLYSDGVPSAGTPKAIKISGGPAEP